MSSMELDCGQHVSQLRRTRLREYKEADTGETFRFLPSCCATARSCARAGGAKESSVKKASMRKQDGRQDTGIRHVGLHVTNSASAAEFYRDVLGMEITGGSTPDHPLGASAFLSSRPDEQSHEIALFANPAHAHFAFKVSSLAEFRSFHARVVEKNIPIKFVFNHRESFAFYFDDPDGNMIQDAAVDAPSACHFSNCALTCFTSGRSRAGSNRSGVPVFSAGTMTQSGRRSGLIGLTGTSNP